MTPACHPNPFVHAAFWCAVWTRLGGTWRMREGRVELVSGDGLHAADRPGLERMLAAVDAVGRQALADHLGAAMDRAPACGQ